MNHHRIAFTTTALACLTTFYAATTSAVAQPVWGLNSASFNGHTEGFADDPADADPPCHNTTDVPTTTPGIFGKDTGGKSYADCGILVFTCPLRGNGYAHFWIDGVGTPQVTCRWYAISRAYQNCERISYRAFGVANLMAGAVLEPTGVPDGTPVTVDYRWWQWSFNNYDPEAFVEDPAQVINGFLDLNGTFLFNGGFDLDNVPGILFDPEERDSFDTLAGIPMSLDVGVDTNAEINNPGKGVYNEDLAVTEFFGEIILSLNGPPAAPGGTVIPYSQLGVEFSLDIGSDTELSDPNADGDEVFDPGDAYLWKTAALPFGTNGIKDDASIFGVDPDPKHVPLTPAPTCGGFPPSQVQTDYFDLDGHDALDFSLQQILPPISDGPPLTPIGFFTTDCMVGTDYLIISFDDDAHSHYVGSMLFCDVPVRSQSPNVDTYGTAVRRDEIIGLNLVNVVSPALVAGEYPIEDEPGLHVSLSPPPDAAEEDDDDTDSLDVNFDPAVCNTWYFSPDHEATYVDTAGAAALDPGGIYEVLPGGGLVQVIDEFVHLGLPEDTDINAFEFVWAADVNGGGPVFTLLFSVDDDDGLTTVDESGGLDPRMIYASDLTGGYYALLDAPLEDDVDALTAWWSPVAPPINVGPSCVCGDLDNSGGPVDLTDFATFATCFGLPPTNPPCDCADLDGDGGINLGDFATFAVLFGTTSTNSPPNCP